MNSLQSSVRKQSQQKTLERNSDTVVIGGQPSKILTLAQESKGRFPLRKISIGSDRIGTKLKPRMGFGYQFSVPV